MLSYNSNSNCTMHKANALKPDAEEAIPELCGKVLFVFISMSYNSIYGQ